MRRPELEHQRLGTSAGERKVRPEFVEEAVRDLGSFQTGKVTDLIDVKRKFGI